MSDGFERAAARMEAMTASERQAMKDRFNAYIDAITRAAKELAPVYDMPNPTGNYDDAASAALLVAGARASADAGRVDEDIIQAVQLQLSYRRRTVGANPPEGGTDGG